MAQAAMVWSEWRRKESYWSWLVRDVINLVLERVDRSLLSLNCSTLLEHTHYDLITWTWKQKERVIKFVHRSVQGQITYVILNGHKLNFEQNGQIIYRKPLLYPKHLQIRPMNDGILYSDDRVIYQFSFSSGVAEIFHQIHHRDLFLPTTFNSYHILSHWDGQIYHYCMSTKVVKKLNFRSPGPLYLQEDYLILEGGGEGEEGEGEGYRWFNLRTSEWRDGLWPHQLGHLWFDQEMMALTTDSTCLIYFLPTRSVIHSFELPPTYDMIYLYQTDGKFHLVFEEEVETSDDYSAYDEVYEDYHYRFY